MNYYKEVVYNQNRHLSNPVLPSELQPKFVYLYLIGRFR
jgi:hypothetical protein